VSAVTVAAVAAGVLVIVVVIVAIALFLSPSRSLSMALRIAHIMTQTMLAMLVICGNIMMIAAMASYLDRRFYFIFPDGAERTAPGSWCYAGRDPQQKICRTGLLASKRRCRMAPERTHPKDSAPCAMFPGSGS